MGAGGDWRWHEAAGKPRGVVAVIHGLNNRAEAMDPVVRALTGGGFHALNFSLHHRPTRADDPAEDWLDIVRQGVNESRSRYPDLPLMNVSYSIGALLALKVLHLDQGVRFVSAVFLAPALALTAGSSLIRLLTPFSGFIKSLASSMPCELRSRAATPLREYRAVVRLIGEASALCAYAADIPVRIVMSPADPLVSYRRISRFLERQQLTTWEVCPVAPDRRGMDHHLLLGAAYVGATCWAGIGTLMLGHLRARAA